MCIRDRGVFGPMRDTPGDDIENYYVTVDVVSPTRDLATYIASTIYPDSSAICVPDEPLTA